MAIAIKTVPVLTGTAARKFNLKAAKALKKKHTVNFAEQVEITAKILGKRKENF